MIWIIASVPLWVLGGLIFFGAIAWAIDGVSGKEPSGTAANAILLCLPLSALVFWLAAKMAS